MGIDQDLLKKSIEAYKKHKVADKNIQNVFIIDYEGEEHSFTKLQFEEFIKETPEQKARDLLEQMEVEGAQEMSCGDVLELANLFAKVERLEAKINRIKGIVLEKE